MSDTITNEDKQRLRELGKRLAEVAADPLQDVHRKIWTAVNDGHMIKPAMLVRDYPVYLLGCEEELTPRSKDPFLASVEADILLKLYEWEHLRCHRVVEPYINCQADISDTGFGIQASSPGATEINNVESREIASAKHFDRVLTCEDDLAMIKEPVVTHDERSTARRLELMNEIFSGVIDVRLHGTDFFQYVPWDDLLSWMGIEEGMYDFVLNPDFMHRAMEHMTDMWISRVKQYEALGLLSSNNGASITGAGGLGFTTRLPAPPENGMGIKLKDMWGFVADQIFTSVSPEMSAEFAFEHEKRFADLFGMIYYGCCERLDHKLDEIKTFGNLRKISMSPYANIEQGMEKMGGTDWVVSFKPNSNYLAVNPPEYGLLQKEIENVCQLARKHNCNVEMVMKTLITLCGEPERLWKWCDLAMEVVKDY